MSWQGVSRDDAAYYHERAVGRPQECPRCHQEVVRCVRDDGMVLGWLHFHGEFVCPVPGYRSRKPR